MVEQREREAPAALPRLLVIGGSAGALEPLSTLVTGLTAEFAAPICVALHVPAYHDSRVPAILTRLGALEAGFAQEGDRLEPGRIYVAPPDRHLMVEGDTIRLTHGPKEHRVRPAVDPLFRSAALFHGPRVVGVILSGALDDGTGGLWTIKDRGGVAVVQDPADATVIGMPASAITNVAVDHVVPAAALGPLLERLLREPVRNGPPPPLADIADLHREVAIASLDEHAHQATERYGEPSRFGCPDCGGVLWRTSRVGPLAFRCEVGHAYGGLSLAESQTSGVEDALWASLRALEDKAELARLRATDAQAKGMPPDRIVSLTAQAEGAQEHAAILRALLAVDGRTGMRADAIG